MEYCPTKMGARQRMWHSVILFNNCSGGHSHCKGALSERKDTQIEGKKQMCLISRENEWVQQNPGMQDYYAEISCISKLELQKFRTPIWKILFIIEF